MPTYRAPVKDMTFLLHDVLQIDRYSNLPGFAEATPDTVTAILDEAAKFCEGVLQPLNQSGDAEGCTRHDDGSVTTPQGFKAAYDRYVELGFGGLTQDPDYGGQGLPHVLGFAFEEMMISANMAFAMYPGLTAGAIACLSATGSDAQKRAYVPKMVEGTWTGTMNLTEPHCGTDLGMIRTKAEPQDDGSYKISGQKIYISAGEHDLSENIIHLVLAKLPDAPEGTRGISLFVVPKFILDEAGEPGERNAVSCGSIEHKMGIHGNATCVLNYDGAKGWLVGEPHKGLKAMFIMMNAARLGVGLQGIALSEVAYQNAADYARDRIQGRSLSGAKDPDAKADPIIVHPDVRRMLMDARAFNEGARAVALWGGLLVDLAEKAQSEEERQEADDLISLLTPVIKGVFTDRGFECATQAQQVFGGAGYIREYGMEQFVRDARIAMIYEGTNGVQALDLVGRKLAKDNGRAVRAYFKLVEDFCAEHQDDAEMAEFTAPLRAALGDLQACTMWLMQNAMKAPDNAGAASTPYMHLMGLVVMGHMWAKMAKVALIRLDEGSGDMAFHENKLITARYFAKHMLPETGGLRAKVEAGADPVMALAADAF
ncbi:acyl-CoA dehydrogenase [Rhodothalassium salexigens]|uniref:acyl-CoA dehydrogenase C-terminal domain-containing protein n=1 Tax=Rhodothalassium salexigens TaxID=1086 RepID=UPI001914CC13|nr:acyl-CoA dehydrogenase C-terminal domain-containing protein [Rhodothalassium salexigens]MBK5920629.1 acyl-CoA dehydrogenase [Rhodothalassium salexigens]